MRPLPCKLVPLLVLTIAFTTWLPAGEDTKPPGKEAATPAATETKKPAAPAKFDHPVTFIFVDEKDGPIKGTFTIHETEKGEFKRNIRRAVPLDEKGAITIDEFPAEFEIGVVSRDEFYIYETTSDKLDAAKREIRTVCTPKGAIKFEVEDLPGTSKPLVVEFHRKNEKGKFEQVRGIGIFAKTGDEQTMGGLDPGEYYIAVKFSYEDPKPLFKSKEFKVVKKEYTPLPVIKITKDDITRSRK